MWGINKVNDNLRQLSRKSNKDAIEKDTKLDNMKDGYKE